MNIKLVTTLIYLIANQVLAQSSTFLSQEKINVLSIIVQNNYFFSNNNYIPYIPGDAIQYSAYATFQARYDRAHSIVSTEYWKLKNLDLINRQNLEYLNKYRVSRIEWVDNNIKSADLSKQEVLNNFVNNLCEIYKRPEIKSEISLLKSCYDEMNRIKRNDPDNFIYSKRYRAIVSVLNKLENIPLSSINSLSWEGEELMNSNGFADNGNVDLRNYKNESRNTDKLLTGYKRKTETSIELVKIEVKESITIVHLIHTAPSAYEKGGWVSIRPDTFIKENSTGKKLKLIKAEGIPTAPNKFEYSAEGQKLSFRLYFPNVDFLNNSIDLIECENDNGCFNFYGIGHKEIISQF